MIVNLEWMRCSDVEQGVFHFRSRKVMVVKRHNRGLGMIGVRESRSR